MKRVMINKIKRFLEKFSASDLHFIGYLALKMHEVKAHENNMLKKEKPK